eukprot:1639043-Rhodomonas_salina.1
MRERIRYLEQELEGLVGEMEERQAEESSHAAECKALTALSSLQASSLQAEQQRAAELEALLDAQGEALERMGTLREESGRQHAAALALLDDHHLSAARLEQEAKAVRAEEATASAEVERLQDALSRCLARPALHWELAPRADDAAGDADQPEGAKGEED